MAPAPTPIPFQSIDIAYLSQEREWPLRPFFQLATPDLGLQGARLGIVDDNTTGAFTHQRFQLKELRLSQEAHVEDAFRQLLAAGYRQIITDIPAPELVKLAALPEAAQVLIYDVASSDDELRGQLCAANLVHLLPSRAMRTDALAQYLAKKRWQKLFLVVGPAAEDRLYAAAMRRSAQKFGLKLVAEKAWDHHFDERRTPESEIPVFTQGVEYDVLLVADEAGSFGDFLSYRSWLPRPVAGTQGLVPLAWHFTLEQWGALQLQRRFHEQSGRWPEEQDYAAWLAIRAIGEAATRTRSNEFNDIRRFLLGEAFSLAGFKGVPLSFRPWDGQLRQPVLLATERNVVAVAPVEGYLHPRNELDTLGLDQAETPCHNGTAKN
jgi:ABC transporter substrate binding protein (PQQ-dependent alcohol dehydrogenase system)